MNACSAPHCERWPPEPETIRAGRNFVHMISKKQGARAAWRACGIALAVAAVSAHAETDAAAPADPQRSQATEAVAGAPAVPVAPISPAAPVEAVAPAAPAAPQTRVRFSRGMYKPGIEQLRVVRRENTMNNIAGQVALNIALSVIAGGVSVGAQGFSKDDLGGTTLEALKDDPLGVNPAISELNDALTAFCKPSASPAGRLPRVPNQVLGAISNAPG